MPDQIAAVRRRLDNLNMKVSSNGRVTLPINGNDLKDIGVPSGPLIGKIISAITDAAYENPNLTKDDAIAIAKQYL